jgi:hypothetical protein
LSGDCIAGARKSRVAEAKKKKGKRIMPKGGYF